MKRFAFPDRPFSARYLRSPIQRSLAYVEAPYEPRLRRAQSTNVVLMRVEAVDKESASSLS